MNKIFLGFVLTASLLIAIPVLADGPLSGCTTSHDIKMPGYTATSSLTLIEGGATTTRYGSGSGEINEDWGMVCLLDSVYSVTDWIFYSLLALVTVFTIWGGFLIVTAGGEAEKIKQGKDFVIYAVVGLIVAFLSRVIPSIAEGIVGA